MSSLREEGDDLGKGMKTADRWFPRCGSISLREEGGDLGKGMKTADRWFSMVVGRFLLEKRVATLERE